MSDQLVYRHLLEFPSQQVKMIPLWITAGSLVIDIRGVERRDVTEVAYLIQYQFRSGLGWVKNQTLKVSGSLSHVDFDASHPYRLAVLPVKGINQFELSVWVNSEYVCTSLDLYCGENQITLKAVDLIDSYELIYPVVKPQIGQSQRILSLNGQMEWVHLVGQSELDSKADVIHTHQIADIGTLQDVLNGKANSADISSALLLKANVVHSHSEYVISWGTPGAIGATSPNTGKFTTLSLTSNANTISPTTGAIICAGGAYFDRNVQVGGQFQVNDVLRHKGYSIGFFNTAPISKPTVAGSRSSGDAMTNLLLSLKNLGLITDTTTV